MSKGDRNVQTKQIRNDDVPYELIYLADEDDDQIRKFKEITEEEARLEGEGDLSLDYWRKVHEQFFRTEYEEKEKKFSEEIPVIFERFEVIYDEEKRK